MRSLSKSLLGGILAFTWSFPAFAGLDVYAGPLGKYYKHDYLSTQAQMAEEMGFEFKTVYPDGEPNWLTDKNAAKKIKAFRKAIEKQTKDTSPDMASWSEEGDDYFIEQLNWDCLAALIHVTSYTIRQDLERPKDFSGDYEDYPAYAESDEKNYYFGPLAILESDMFLPSKGEAFILAETPLKGEIIVTSTSNLKRTLQFLEKNLWHGAAKPEEWYERGPASTGVEQSVRISEETGEPEVFEIEHPPVEDLALHNAEYAYGVLFKMLAYSEKHKVPIAMDG